MASLQINQKIQFINNLLHTFSLSSPPNLNFSLSLLNALRSLSVSPTHFSFIPVLKISASSRNLSVGTQIHGSVVKSHHYLHIHLRNALIHLYTSCGSIVQARKLFDEMPSLRDSISWSSLMNGYVEAGKMKEVSCLFNEMKRFGFAVNTGALVCLLGTGFEGRETAHGLCLKTGIMNAGLSVVSEIIGVYLKMGSLEKAKRAFDEVKGKKDVVLYNHMISGYAREHCFEDCVMLLTNMKCEGLRMNSGSLVGLLSACGSNGNLSVGRQIIDIAKGENLEIDGNLGTAVLDMYVKCGCIDEAIKVFDKMVHKDVLAWTAMIMGLGRHGRFKDVIRVFHMMLEGGVKPNDVTFLAVLNACCHGGMVDLAKEFFLKMVAEYGIKPSITHYGCMIDLFGKAGLLEEAYELIENLPMKGDAVSYRALLASCREFGNVKIGELAQSALVDLGDEHPSDSILLTRTHALLENWEDVGRLRSVERVGMKTFERKERGYSLVEMSG